MPRLKTATNKKAEEVKQAMKEPVEVKPKWIDCISTGSTMLNLAASQRGRTGGFPRGRLIRFVGDNSSGKTLVSMETMAQAFWNLDLKPRNLPEVTNKVLKYFSPEGGIDFPITDMYGKEFEDFLEMNYSNVVEEVGGDILTTIREMKDGDFFLAVIDSWDALKSKVAKDRFKKASEAGEVTEGSYNLEKQKYATQEFLPELADIMQGKDATIIFVAQSREAIGETYGSGKRVGGGGGFKFYIHQEPWLREVKKLKKTVKGNERVYGIDLEAMFKKNKVALPFRKVQFTAYFDYGLDDIGSMLDWLFGPEKSNRLKKEEIDTLELSVSIASKTKDLYKKNELITHIEDNNLEGELQDMAEFQWLDIEDKVKTKRKKRF